MESTELHGTGSADSGSATSTRASAHEVTRRPNIYIPNQAGHDYSSATKFGELVYVTKGKIRKYDLTAFHERAAEIMRDSQPEDYVLISSLNSICAICTAILARKHGRINFLLYRQDRYVEYNIQLEGGQGGGHTPVDNDSRRVDPADVESA